MVIHITVPKSFPLQYVSMKVGLGSLVAGVAPLAVVVDELMERRDGKKAIE